MRNKVALEMMIPRKGDKKNGQGPAEEAIYAYVQADESVHDG